MSSMMKALHSKQDASESQPSQDVEVKEESVHSKPSSDQAAIKDGQVSDKFDAILTQFELEERMYEADDQKRAPSPETKSAEIKETSLASGAIDESELADDFVPASQQAISNTKPDEKKVTKESAEKEKEDSLERLCDEVDASIAANLPTDEVEDSAPPLDEEEPFLPSTSPQVPARRRCTAGAPAECSPLNRASQTQQFYGFDHPSPDSDENPLWCPSNTTKSDPSDFSYLTPSEQIKSEKLMALPPITLEEKGKAKYDLVPFREILVPHDLAVAYVGNDIFARQANKEPYPRQTMFLYKFAKLPDRCIEKRVRMIMRATGPRTYDETSLRISKKLMLQAKAKVDRLLKSRSPYQTRSNELIELRKVQVEEAHLEFKGLENAYKEDLAGYMRSNYYRNAAVNEEEVINLYDNEPSTALRRSARLKKAAEEDDAVVEKAGQENELVPPSNLPSVDIAQDCRPQQVPRSQVSRNRRLQLPRKKPLML